jgi:hypothetical protein
MDPYVRPVQPLATAQIEDLPNSRSRRNTELIEVR